MIFFTLFRWEIGMLGPFNIMAVQQALQIQIARLQKQKFGASSERTLREIEQLELALEYLEITGAAEISCQIPEGDMAVFCTTPASFCASPSSSARVSCCRGLTGEAAGCRARHSGGAWFPTLRPNENGATAAPPRSCR